MFKKFFDCSISGILLAIGLGSYLTALIMFGLPSVSVFCFFSSVLCFGMAFYIYMKQCLEYQSVEGASFNFTAVASLIALGFMLMIIGMRSASHSL